MKEQNGKFQIERKDDELLIEITSFSSSGIAGMLSGMNNLDWRSSVEQVAIDPDYDGENFQSVIVDVPEAAIDFVKGSYSVPADKVGDCVGVKITDILGESVILSQDVS